MSRPPVPEGWSLIYAGDPMCSWCYGFAPSLAAAHARWPEVPLRLMMGGLRVQGLVLDEQLRAFLRHHWTLVARQTGQPFIFDALELQGVVYSTEPACRAVVTVRELDPPRTLPMFRAIQRAFYAQGHDTTDADNLTDIAQGVGIVRAAFEAAFDSEDMRDATANDFAVVQRWGITGFPTLLAVRGGQAQVVAPGWLSPPDLIERLEAVWQS